MTDVFELPWMPPAEIVRVEGRGEFFVRRHRPPRSRPPDRHVTARMDGVGRPAVLHRLQGARRALLVHRDRSSGPRPRAPNARAVRVRRRRRRPRGRCAPARYRASRARRVLDGRSDRARRSPVAIARSSAGIVVQATALEWLASRRERWQWRFLPMLGSLLRSRWYPGVPPRRPATMISDRARPRAVPRLARSRRSTVATRTRSPRRDGRSVGSMPEPGPRASACPRAA